MSLIDISDGSVKGYCATHAWTLMTGHNDSLAMCGSGLVDGDQHSTLSSFWAEVQGQVALLVMMTLLA